MRLLLFVVTLSLAACSAPGGDDGGAGGSGGTGGSGGGAGGGYTGRRLGLNDVTVLVPLPPDAGTPTLLKATDLAADGTPLVPDALYQQVIRRSNGQPDVFSALSDFHVVAVRFDLCDRQLPWPCDALDDGRLRLVFQPVFGDGNARDIALHGFYEIPKAEVAGAVAELRAMAELQDLPLRGKLTVNAALAANPSGPYGAALKTFLRRWASSAGLRRLTFFAQPDVFAQIRWVFRGLEGTPGNYALIQIAAADGGTEQDVILAGTLSSPGYTATPLSDEPLGLARAIDAQGFAAASQPDKDAALHALTSVNNPLEHSPNTVQCIACHVSTLLSDRRALEVGTTADQLPGRYGSGYDLSIDGGRSAAPNAERFLRALGWFDKVPLISQRVVNESAQTATELQQRFPVP
jgi:hypothetical protein